MVQLTVLIADDHALLRQGVALLLGREEDFQIVGEAADGLEALNMAKSLQPDILLLDIRMLGMSGIEVLANIQKQSPRTKVLILSGFLEEEFLLAAIERGARGYLPKTSAYKDLARAIRAVHAGELWVQRRMLTLLLDSVLQKLNESTPGLAERQGNLTSREREIICRVIQGMTNKEVAADLGISEKTVKAHLSNIFGKLEISRRVQLSLYRIADLTG